MSTTSATYEAGYDPKYGYNRNAFAHRPPHLHALGKVVQLITTPIGLAAEAIAHRRSKTGQYSADAASCSADGAIVELPRESAQRLVDSGQAVPAEGREPTHEMVIDDDEVDEVDWALDDAAAEFSEEEVAVASEIEDERQPGLDAADHRIEISQGSTTSLRQTEKLSVPVILPQRRPRTKTRGFVRAYAPILGNHGIDQRVFMAFLQSLHKASQASPIFDVIMLGTAIAGSIPEPTVAASMQVLQVAAMVAQEVQEQWRTNRFLDQANKEIFMPRGLYCMIVTYQPTLGGEEVVQKRTVDIGAQALAKYGGRLLRTASDQSNVQQQRPADGGHFVPQEPPGESSKLQGAKEKLQGRLHISSATTRGEAEMPVTCAPLVYPDLDARLRDASVNLEGDKQAVSGVKEKAMRSSKFVNDYFDRRQRMIESTANPESVLNQLSGGKPEFKSKIGDPNDGRNHHLITLLTGGKIKAEPLGARRRWERAQRKEAERFAKHQAAVAEKLAKGEVVEPMTPKRRLLQENILYLAIVNMPSEQEVVKAKQDMAESKKTKNSTSPRETANIPELGNVVQHDARAEMDV